MRLRILRTKRANRGGQEGEDRGHDIADAQDPLAAGLEARGIDTLFQIGKALARHGHHCFPGGGERDAAARSFEQGKTKRLFEKPNLLT
jgi:hypothetical protein